MNFLPLNEKSQQIFQKIVHKMGDNHRGQNITDNIIEDQRRVSGAAFLANVLGGNVSTFDDFGRSINVSGRDVSDMYYNVCQGLGIDGDKILQ